MPRIGTIWQRPLHLVTAICVIVFVLERRLPAAEPGPPATNGEAAEQPSDIVDAEARGVSAESFAELRRRLDNQAEQIARLRRALEEESQRFGPRRAEKPGGCEGDAVDRVPLVADLPWEPTCDSDGGSQEARRLRFLADYENGFRIRPFNAEEDPFELKIDGWIQFRHHGFARERTLWRDRAGTLRPIRNRNAFDIERGRLLFSGHAVDRRLTYFLQLDGDTDGGHSVDFFDYWWSWKFCDAAQVVLGKRKVTASRQWLLTARDTRLVDRPMANDFFRPDRTVGVFLVGDLERAGNYELMVGNSYRAANLPNREIDNRFTFAATHYVDRGGAYGRELVDFAGSPRGRWRLGHSLVYSSQVSEMLGQPSREVDFVRLSDGTRLTQPGALGAGVTVSEFDVCLYGVDVAWKRNGWSVNSEVFLRWLEDLRADGPLHSDSLFQHGFYVEGGRFLVPQRFDVNARYSQVRDDFGSGTEWAAGCNWYPLGKSTFKLSFDVTHLDGSPLQNTTSDILAGDRGTLLRTQFQAEF